MQLETVHQRQEQESLEIHRRIARLLDDDALPVLEKARANLRRWLSVRGEDLPATVEDRNPPGSVLTTDPI